MKKILFLFLLTGFMFACKKDNVGTKPIITFLSYSPATVDSSTQELYPTFKVQDGDGDIENYIAWKIHFLQTPDIPPTDSFTRFRMPNIGQNNGNSVNAEVSVRMIGTDFRLWKEDGGVAPDSLWYTVFILDNAGHSSDTITTARIGIIKRAP